MDDQGKVISCSIHLGGPIGLHKHEKSDNINCVISGQGKAVCDGQEEILSAGACHICKKSSEQQKYRGGRFGFAHSCSRMMTEMKVGLFQRKRQSIKSI